MKTLQPFLNIETVRTGSYDSGRPKYRFDLSVLVYVEENIHLTRIDGPVPKRVINEANPPRDMWKYETRIDLYFLEHTGLGTSPAIQQAHDPVECHEHEIITDPSFRPLKLFFVLYPEDMMSLDEEIRVLVRTHHKHDYDDYFDQTHDGSSTVHPGGPD